MSLHATPLLYLNMGGEMLYVLQQRLKAQEIDSSKSIQVLDDVTAALLNPKILSSVFEPLSIINIPCIRSTLECIALSSIMKLDKDSMNKLFDLMIIMVKYQLTASTGPREVILSTLNHTDAMRDIVTNKNIQDRVNLVHRMIIDLYGNMTMDQVWQARNDCLKELEVYKVRVSILLRFGLQNNDTSFNLTPKKYNERYTEREDTLKNLKLNDMDCNKYYVGSFHLYGDRITLLGRNMYSSSYGLMEKTKHIDQQFLEDRGTKAELQMLAIQLGTEETSCEKPISLNVFSNETDETINVNANGNNDSKINMSHGSQLLKDETVELNKEYKLKLDNVYADFFNDEHVEIKRTTNLLELLDEIE